jgi:predicted permease
MGKDLLYAWRTLRGNPGLSLVIVLSLAIGIGANTAIFSVVDALLLRPLPYPHPERLANIWLHSPGLGIFRDWPSPGQFLDLRNENHSFEEMVLAQLNRTTITGLERPELLNSIETTSALFRLLGAKPLLGRLLLPEDDQPGRTPVAVLSSRLWQRLYGSGSQLAGKTISLNGKTLAIAGVLPPDFLLNTEVMPAEVKMDKLDVFLPLHLVAEQAQSRYDENYNIMVRLKPGVSVAQAQADVDAIARRIRDKDKRDQTFGMSVIGLGDQVVGDVRRALLVMLGAVALVLLIACANVANLLLARAAGRQKEIAIRAALGAGGARIARQLLIESVLLALIGGTTGLIVARWTLDVVRTLNPGNIPGLNRIHIDGAVLAFTFGISLATGILFGLAPAWRALKIDLNTALKSGGRSGRADGGLGLGRNRLRALLVISELALSLILLTGAGLLIQSFIRLQNVSPGFSADHILTMEMAVVQPQKPEEFPAFWKAVARADREIRTRVLRLPGVEAEGEVSGLPLTGSVGWGQIGVEGFTPRPGQELQVNIQDASPDYFKTMGIPLLNGRFFSERDTSENAAIVDARFARRFWPQGNAVGKHLWFNPKNPITIVGVVGAVRQDSLAAESKIAVYFSAPDWADRYLVVRTTSEPARLANAVAREVRAASPDAVVYDIRAMQDRVQDSLARQRFSMLMLGAFAAFALLLAILGVYGVMSHLVSQSTRDIGVRIALGARPENILSLVVRQGMGLAALGIGAGLAGAFALTRAMSSLLFGVAAHDAMTYGTVALLMAGVALMATVIPARRAASLDPMQALRED